MYQEASSVDGKVALVTGAARRIGACIAERLHRRGASVAVHYRGSEKDAIRLVDALNESRTGSAAAFRADLTATSDCVALIDTVHAWKGQLDLLVNNASSFFPTPLGTISEDQWSDLAASNLKAPLFLSQAAWPHLNRAQGNIVNIVDIHARRPLKNYPAYVSAKAGLEMLTRSLAKEMAPQVRVNGVAPGAILWPEDEMSDQTKANILQQVPLGRPGAPEDIAECVRFLVEEATYTTGHVIAVDGGRSAGW